MAAVLSVCFLRSDRQKWSVRESFWFLVFYFFGVAGDAVAWEVNDRTEYGGREQCLTSHL